MDGLNPCANLTNLINQIRIKFGMPRESFELAVLPVIAAYREYSSACSGVCLCQPAPSRCPLLDQLTVAGFALDYRRGRILPPNVAPEEIGERAHRWTYAVFVAALLLGDRKHDGASFRKAVLQGAQNATSDLAPTANSPSSRVDESTEDRLLVFKRVVPEVIVTWLAEDKTLLNELQGLLSRDGVAKAGAIGLLVKRASQAFAGMHNEVAAVSEAVGDMVAAPRNPEGNKSPASAAASVSDTAASSGRDKENPAAKRFMHWLKTGITDGSRRFNQVGALVHFVAEGMLLISPQIFREFARRFGEAGDGVALTGQSDESRLGLGIQRQVIRAGWHRRTANGLNVHKYEVVSHGKSVSTLSGVLILNPERFIQPLPPANPFLGRRLSL